MSNSTRRLTLDEEGLLVLLVNKALLTLPENWKEGILVRSMDDGGMGSLYLFPNGELNTDRIFGDEVSDFQFTDEDGVEVIASLNVDDKGNLFELDVWKTDFSKLISIPKMLLR